jgi:hypothetical protein
MTTYDCCQHRSPIGFLFILVLAVIALVAVGVLLNSPLTVHAANSHIGQYNSNTISELMKQGICKPVLIYNCPRVNQIKILCQVKPGVDLWAGLILGTRDVEHTVIVTGFAARFSYWEESIFQDGCFITAGG